MGIKRHTERSLSITCTDPEISYRKKEYPNFQTVLDQKHKICCTACGRNLMKELQTGLLCTHPSLEVIICKECLQFYGDGLFKTDKKGDDVYCRWCAQGGTIYCCSKCSVAFCKKCIDRNLKNDKKVMTDINKDNWACFVCTSKPLWPLRAFCWAVQKYKKELIGDSRKRKLSTSSADSLEKSKPGPASVKKSFAGPASKKAKIETTPVSAQKKPGPASKTILKKPGPASRTNAKEPETKTPTIQTRHKKIDYSPKIEFPFPDPPKRTAPKRVTKNKKKSPNRGAQKSRKFVPDVSSDEEFDDFEDEEESDVSLDHETTGPIENVMGQVFDFCFKLSNNFNSKLIKYQLFYKGNMSTSEKVNNACVNVHMDLKKIVRLFNAIDEKMMSQLDEFNAVQQALEQEKLDNMEESVAGDIDIESYGIDPKTPPEPEVSIHQNEDDDVIVSEDPENLERMDVTVDKSIDENKEQASGDIADKSIDIKEEKEQDTINTDSKEEHAHKTKNTDVEAENGGTKNTDAEAKYSDETKNTVAEAENSNETNNSDVAAKDGDKTKNTDVEAENDDEPKYGDVDAENGDKTKNTDIAADNGDKTKNAVAEADNGDGTKNTDVEAENGVETKNADEKNNTIVEDFELSNTLSDEHDSKQDAKLEVESEEINENQNEKVKTDEESAKGTEINDEKMEEEIGEKEDEATEESGESKMEDESVSTKAGNSDPDVKKSESATVNAEPDIEKEHNDSSTGSQENDETINGLSDPVKDNEKDSDGLSDISDKYENFDSFDKIGTKELLTGSLNHSNGHAPATGVTTDKI